MIICDRCGKHYQEGGIGLRDTDVKKIYQLCSDCKKGLWDTIRSFLHKPMEERVIPLKDKGKGD